MYRNEHHLRAIRNSSFQDKKSINSDLQQVTSPKYTSSYFHMKRRTNSNIISRYKPKSHIQQLRTKSHTRYAIKYIPKVSIGESIYPSREKLFLPIQSNNQHEFILIKQNSFYVAQTKPNFTIINTRQRNQASCMYYFTLPDKYRRIESASGLHKCLDINRNPSSLMN